MNDIKKLTLWQLNTLKDSIEDIIRTRHTQLDKVQKEIDDRSVIILKKVNNKVVYIKK